MGDGALVIYPANCPVFEVIAGSGGHGFKLGTHVTGVPSNDPLLTIIAYDGEERTTDSPWAIRSGQYMKPEWLRPLTPAAQAVLDAVRS